ncbi:MAG: GNAT family N-acetyltransferase [Aquabacterium sp.]
MDEIQSSSSGAQPRPDAQTRMVPALTVHWHDSLDEIDTAQWDEMAMAVPGGTPFLRHDVLSAFIDSGSACAETGWQARFLTLRNPQGRVMAGCPIFLKSHSYGEYVFDWAWADAHDRALRRQGQHYYPKLLSAVPFSPIPGQRLLVSPHLPAEAHVAAQRTMLRTLVEACEAQQLSSAHVLFMSPRESELARHEGWLVRHGVQFHWDNRNEAQGGRPYVDFDDFLASLQRDKRKKIQQERRKVRDAGVSFEVIEGLDITPADWDFFHRCYSQTYLDRGQQPYLTRAFWTLAWQAAPQAWALFIAHRGGQRMAAALLALDPVHRIAYGRYWGALAQVSCLHFEACYYHPLAWCIAHGWQRFEGGAQGEHKLTRGLLPVPTSSAHWIRHEGLRDAIHDFIEREKHGVAGYIDELDERSPFKPQDQGP